MDIALRKRWMEVKDYKRPCLEDIAKYEEQLSNECKKKKQQTD